MNKNITYDITILMPCLNEEGTLADCIHSVSTYFNDKTISYEILVVDNLSTDASRTIAINNGARVICEKKRGYGSALRSGIDNARGRFIIMGDCDTTYDWANLDLFIDRLNEGYALVVGNRFACPMEKGAMPFLHKRIGVPFLSYIARKKYKVSIGDFHCGLRGFDTQIARQLNLSCDGMEFATEIIASFARGGYRITEVPTTLKRCIKKRKPHLRTFRDGYRHLRYILKNK